MRSKGKLTPLVGKPDPTTGGWIVPKPSFLPAKELSAIATGYDSFKVQVRDLRGVTVPEDVARILGGFLQQIQDNAEVRITLNYGEPDRHTKMHNSQSARTYKVGEVYEVSGPEALRLLNTFPYSFLFEEVEEAPLTNKVVDTLDKESAIAALLEENKRLREEHQAQMALLMERFDRLEQPPASSKKKTLRDIEE
jgi:hypothetical protein